MNWLVELQTKRLAQNTNVYLVETFDMQRLQQLHNIAKGKEGQSKLKDLLKVEYDNIVELNLQRDELTNLINEERLPTDQMVDRQRQLDEMLTSTKTFAIIYYVFTQPHADRLSDSLATWSQDKTMHSKSCTIVVFTSDANLFNETLRRLCYHITIEPSTAEERRTILENTAKDLSIDFEKRFNEKLKLKITEDIVQASSGLDLHSTETAALESFFTNPKRQFDVTAFSDYKIRIVKEYGMEFIQPKFGYSLVGGEEMLKEYTTNNVIVPLRDPELADKYGVGIPKGMIIAGIPGTGKDHFTEATAYELGLAMVKLTPADFFRGIVGESIPYSEEILTDQGLQKIGHVVSTKTANRAFTLANNKLSAELIREYMPKSAPPKLLLIKTKTGRKVKVTKDHPLLSMKNGIQKFIHGTEIKANETYIAIPRKLEPLNEYAVDPHLATVFGLWLAEGSFTQNGEPRFSSADKRIVEFIKENLEKHGATVSVYKVKNSRVYDIQCKNAKRLFKDFTGDCYTKRTPANFFKANYKAIASLLKGYFSGDGTSSGRVIEAYTTSRGLASDILYLLLFFGIVARCGIRRKGYKPNASTLYRITISNVPSCREFVESIGFLQPNKIKRTAEYINAKKSGIEQARDDVIPVSKAIIEAFTGGGNWYERKGIITRELLQKRLEIIDPDKKLKLWHFVESSIRWDLVIEVKEVENIERVYDISMNPTETFVGGFGGVILHNSESRVKQVFNLIESLGRVVVYIPEVDQMFIRRGQVAMTDSIPSYVPITVKRRKNEEETLDVVTFEELWQNIEGALDVDQNGHDVLIPNSDEEWYVLSKSGEPKWTRLKHIMRHPYEGTILRISTATAVMDVSPNHPMVIEWSPPGAKGDTKPAEKMKVGDRIPVLTTTPVNGNGLFIGNTDLAWLYGLFVADGSAYEYPAEGRECYRISFANVDESRLAKAKQIFEAYFHVVLSNGGVKNGVHKLEGSSRAVYNFFRQSFYTPSGFKKVSTSILNATNQIKQAFFEGYYEGDGDKQHSDKSVYRFSTDSQTLAQGLLCILRTLHPKLKITVQTRKDKPHVLTVVARRGQRINPRRINKIAKLHYKGWLYDVETEDHRFFAGVGNIKSHNSGVQRRITDMMLDRTGKRDRQYFLMGSTNFIDQMDNASIRPGRFDEVVLQLPPSTPARKQILIIHTSGLRKMPIGKDVDFDTIAEKTFCWTPAELEKLCLTAGRFAMKERAPKILASHFESALGTIEINMSERQQRMHDMVAAMRKLDVVSKQFIDESIKAFSKSEKDESRASALIKAL
jgi:SpoVK/Ycf46/Vps4 family AAA+-type ATPase/intein/homing endonuclease